MKIFTESLFLSSRSNRNTKTVFESKSGKIEITDLKNLLKKTLEQLFLISNDVSNEYQDLKNQLKNSTLDQELLKTFFLDLLSKPDIAKYKDDIINCQNKFAEYLKQINKLNINDRERLINENYVSKVEWILRTFCSFCGWIINTPLNGIQPTTRFEETKISHNSNSVSYSSS
jgi:hypothetical protein